MNSSRLLARLDAEIAASRDPRIKHCLQAERSCYLARRGRFEEAQATISELRDKYRMGPDPEVSAWLHLAEGLLIHFQSMGPLARDKIQRASALCAAAGITRLGAISAAWLANMDYLVVNMEGMSRHVRRAFENAAETNHSALSRANLVVAHAFHLAARLDLAKPWYARAHFHATTEGDDATLGALIHNMAWLRCANLRQETLCGTAFSPSGEYALVGVDSTLQFDNLFGDTSLDALAPVLRAQVLAAKERFREALAAYREYLLPAVKQGLNRLHANFLADQAWCLVNLGDIDSARIDADLAESLIDPDGQFDDRAPAHSRLAQVYAALGDSATSDRHQQMANVAWEGHKALQGRILELLADLKLSDYTKK
jgi:tetratricopeptide (TPR) repeat protein